MRSAGVTILELMVCMVILTGVIIVFATVFPSGYRLGLANLNEHKAASLASSILEEVKGRPFSDANFEAGYAATNFVIETFVANTNQSGWPGVTVVNTNPPADTQPIVTKFPTNPMVAPQNFPRTVVTVGVPQPQWPGDQGVFTLPIKPTDTPAGVTGIDVRLAGVDLRNGNWAQLPNANTIITTTIRVTIAWTETRQTGRASINKSVTMTGYVSKNAR
ncbi:MAG TPA: hypothetical protein VGO93_15635 [Candidatus Xenobia bacterium]|jgi:hypothetical protein